METLTKDEIQKIQKYELHSLAYEIYKKSVGGITMNGDKMKELYDLPMNIQDAWREIDLYYDDLIRNIKLKNKKYITCFNCNDDIDSNCENEKRPICYYCSLNGCHHW